MTTIDTEGRRGRGIAFVSLGALGFSASILFNRAIQDLSGPRIAFFRAVAGFLFLTLLTVWYPEARAVRRYRASIGLLIGLGLAVGLTATLYMTALRHTTAALAVLLNNMSAVYVALLAPWLLNEPRPRHTWLSVALALVGMVLIVDPANLEFSAGSWIGLVTSFACGVTYAFTMIFSRLLRGQVGGVTQAWWSTGMAALVAMPFAFGTPLAQVAGNWYWFLALGVFTLGLPYFLYFLGFKDLTAQVGSLVALLEPVLGVLIGMVVYQEVPTVYGFLGIGMILTGIVLVAR
ncbi:MAG: EamA family transporter [Anaerolineae bacterium]|nr:EamA family transporter [Anaerolineae bacterium]